MTPIERAVAVFERLSPASLSELQTLYAPAAWFKDPFHECQGTAAITAIFARMFAQLDEPRFVVHDRMGDAAQGFVTWTLHFRWRGQRRPRQIRGATHWQFDDQGRIRLHRDYWDAAEELYAQLPLLGALMRWLARRVAGPDASRG
ncbi:MAG: nuclear transport factor 2 family protein [Tepidimonas sp.]|uniref:nuclear transport factor 2 family protein n=1 Tax=Tepidimonas sp. TaxID=2002775 RepID=UPI00298EF391|nr:nuclear transport factor 2 family protein [Tepidimonas sp.]MCS6810019.1 nuclear transport factor 2 family protein [Tepidimonas sp.]MCX7742438.1 nuclear transport factor 2 family protein [Tepidimonas sp.]MDW8336109.1 nuclear transport factor 2 family protein [Tepidimonas sp.]